MHHPTDRIIHTTAFDTPVMEHWLEREIADWVTSQYQLQTSGFLKAFSLSSLQIYCCQTAQIAEVDINMKICINKQKPIK